ncbi:hypothetical protein HXX76_013586 [Chlamydomonas incerta]|uniref:phytol kinase n=1 Tax=Chlamydomonas incerta TaxID=51695 RepID=A0A835SE05_CHLIN|nr:hypothetical protein HXX76_013586 [Chlamydomonas incerta]|eukprot:KAG2425542.1 hypothetical protein HXX76_013586 [Chlamydomonas incerta]
MGNAPSSDGHAGGSAKERARDPPGSVAPAVPVHPPSAGVTTPAALHALKVDVATASSSAQPAATRPLSTGVNVALTASTASAADAATAPPTPRMSHDGGVAGIRDDSSRLDRDEAAVRAPQPPRPRPVAPPTAPPPPSDRMRLSAAPASSTASSRSSATAAAGMAVTAAAAPPPPPATQLPRPSPSLLRPVYSLVSCGSTASLSSVATSTTAITSAATASGGALSRASSAAAAGPFSSRTTSVSSLSGIGLSQPKQQQPKQQQPKQQQQQPKQQQQQQPQQGQRQPGSASAAPAAPAATAGSTCGRDAVKVDLLIPLDPPVAGMTTLHVVKVQAQQLTSKHASWLAAGWGRVPKAAAAEAFADALLIPPSGAATGANAPGAASSSSGGGKGKAHAPVDAAAAAAKAAAAKAAAAKRGPLPKVLGFDTEFVGDQLAVVQLCAGPHVLLVQVPSSRQPAKQEHQHKQKMGGSKVASGGQPQPPARFTLNAALKALLCDPSIHKAAAEAWQDALMVYMGFGVKLRGGLDLTVAVPPDATDMKRGRDKLGLFDIFRTFFPATDHVAKDKTINHAKWLAKDLDAKQMRYAALDAFVSYAAGVCVLLRPGKAPPLPVDLAAAPEWELQLAAQWVAVYQFLEAQSPIRTQHDFHKAEFTMFKKTGVGMAVHMARYNTRLRQRCWVEVALPDGRRINGRCNSAQGTSATVIKLRWSDTKRNVNSLSELPAKLTSIEMTDSSDTPEEAGVKALLPKVLCGVNRMRGRPLLEGIFGGGDFAFPASASSAGGAPAAASSSSAAGGGGKKAKGKAQSSNSSGASLSIGSSDVAATVAVSHTEAAVRLLQQQGTANASQARALSEILRGTCRTGQAGRAEGSAVQLVQGPPGTGKTTVISHAVQIWLQQVAPRLPCLPCLHGSGAQLMPAAACVARSNVAAKNIALSLIKRGLGPKHFRLIVSKEFHYEWHEDQYRGALESVLLLSTDLMVADMQRALLDVQVYVTTVSMLANPNFKATALHGKALSWLVVDEASQIYAADVLLPLYEYGHHLSCLSLFGDDMQLPPYGTEWNGAQIGSIFDHFSGSGGRALQHLREQPRAFIVGPPLCPPAAAACAVTTTSPPVFAPVVRLMLEVSYRLPRDICAFISREMYGAQLKSGREGGGGCGGAPSDAFPAHVLWVNVVGEEERKGGRSCSNPVEAKRAVTLVQERYRHTSWTILTGYDLQRSVLEAEVMQRKLGRHQHQHQHIEGAGAAGGSSSGGGTGGGGGKGGKRRKLGSDRVYNVDTFQGREDEVVVVSLTRVKALGFMEDDRRVNVMLTRCTQQLVVVGSLRLALKHPHTLIGRMADHCSRNGLVVAAAAVAQGLATAVAVVLAPPATEAAARGPECALCPRPRVIDVLGELPGKREQMDLLQQVRPLLAGPGVQLCATWAALCSAMAVRQRATDGSVQQLLAPTSSQLQRGLPPGLVRPLGAPPRGTMGGLTAAPHALAAVIQATASGPCDLAIAQPPVGYDRLPQGPQGQLPPQLQPQRPVVPSARSAAAVAAATAAETAETAADTAAQGAQATAAVLYSAVHAYGLLYKIWGCLACDGASYTREMCMMGVVMARLLTELPPRQAAARLPGWWRLLVQAPAMLVHDLRLARELGHLLRLQLNAPPPPAWAGEVADAASVAAASRDWLPESAAVQGAVAAKAAASLARGKDPSYSLRCALDAGLLSALERCLRAPQAWREAGHGPDSAGALLNAVNSMLRYSSVWPAVLARGPVQQTVSLIATLGAAARLLAQDDVRMTELSYASQPGLKRVVDSGAGAYLCAYLAALLEQVVDVRALSEGAAQQRVGPGQEEPQQQAREQQQVTEQQQPSSEQAAGGAVAALAGPALYFNSVLEPLLPLEGWSFDEPSHCSIAWMAAAGGLTAPGSAADRQQQLLAGFAVHHWLPVLAKATVEAMEDSRVDDERRVLQALLVGRLLMAVLWHEGDTWRHVRSQDDDGAGAPGTGGEESGSPRPEAAWWGAPQLTEELVQSMHTIAYALSSGPVGGLLFLDGSAWQQAAALDLLQSYWTRFPDQAYRMTAEQADGEQRGGQDRAAGGSCEAAPQQPAPAALTLRSVAPLHVQALAIKHGRQDIVDYLDTVARTMGPATDIGAAGCADERGAASGGSGCAHAGDLPHQLWAKWRVAMRPPYPWLLSRAEMQAGLHELLVAEAVAAAVASTAVRSEDSAALRSGSSSSSNSSNSGGGGCVGTGGGDGSGSSRSGGGQDGSGGSSGGPVFAHRLCGNPSCGSLDGPGALIAPSGGKTCARCRAVTYCCGVCQLADWRQRHSRTCGGAVGAAAGAVGAVKAGEKRA